MCSRRTRPIRKLRLLEESGSRIAISMLFVSTALARQRTGRSCIFTSTAGAKTWDRDSGCLPTSTPRNRTFLISWELEGFDSKDRRDYGHTMLHERINKMNE